MDRLIFPELLKPYITAFFTGKYPGADLSEISRIFKIKKDNIFMPIQKHTDKIVMIESSLEPKIADAVITNQKGILLGVQTADCVPLLLYDSERKVCGAVHAGWRGTAEGILKKTLDLMINRFMSDPKNIIIAIGPGIRWCCYAVGQDVLESVRGLQEKESILFLNREITALTCLLPINIRHYSPGSLRRIYGYLTNARSAIQRSFILTGIQKDRQDGKAGLSACLNNCNQSL